MKHLEKMYSMYLRALPIIYFDSSHVTNVKKSQW